MTTTTSTSNSDHQIGRLDQWSHARAFSFFDVDDDGTISQEELRGCLSFLGLDGYHDQFDKFLELDEDGKVKISQILNLLAAKNAALDWMMVKRRKDQNDEFIININQLDKALPLINGKNSNFSKLRDIFLGLTGQAAVSFIAYAPMATSSASATATGQLYVAVGANAVAFLFLLLSFGLGGRKKESAEKFTGAMGIFTAAAGFYLMMGMFLPGTHL
ncbi:hypothetical protein MANES_04G036400v8 [Manihot esculenta]|uniref:EF-hand domain-containing protein n=1 Tax=Manihot esculenta TaxID=3983 RepID=A0A2C9W1Q1_MANES|nr:hypothetical protein MANES_04G036400v8 [Manihot esculenta]